jgi:hypothetical protein
VGSKLLTTQLCSVLKLLDTNFQTGCKGVHNIMFDELSCDVPALIIFKGGHHGVYHAICGPRSVRFEGCCPSLCLGANYRRGLWGCGLTRASLGSWRHPGVSKAHALGLHNLPTWPHSCVICFARSNRCTHSLSSIFVGNVYCTAC